MTISLVITAIGPDRPGIVNLLSDVARQYGANWAESRMANLAGQFAGMVHFEVSEAKAEQLAAALKALESSDLRIVIAQSPPAATPAATHAATRKVRLELIGHDRPGIVRDLSQSLADRGVSIDELHTEVADAAMSGGPLFKVKALLAVPEALSNNELKRGLEALANEMMVDLGLGE
jgi:glycine cleavage system regulatory protein